MSDRELTDIPIFTTDRAGFEIAFNNMNRIWFEGESMPSSRAFARMAPFPDLIFIRDDGWSIGCLERDIVIVFSLWKEKWTHIIRLTQ